MSTSKDELFSKVCELIQKRKNELTEEKPIVHTYEDGAYLHYFSSWEDYLANTKMKPIKRVGQYPSNRKPMMVFAKKGTHIPLTKYACTKTYVVIRGRIDFLFEDNVIRELESFSTIIIEKEKIHGIMVREDTFVMVCEED